MWIWSRQTDWVPIALNGVAMTATSFRCGWRTWILPPIRAFWMRSGSGWTTASWAMVAPTEAQRDVLVRAMQRDYDWQIKPEWLVFLPGVEPGFNLALSACTSPFGGAMQELSVYAPLRAAPGNWGLIKNEVWQSAESGRWESNHAEMVAAARISSAMLFATRRTQLGAFIPAKSWSFGPSYACATTWWLSRTRSIAA